MKKTKQLFAAAAALAVCAQSFGLSAFAADAASPQAQEIAEKLSAYSTDFGNPIDPEIIPYEDISVGWVNYYDFDVCEGLAVKCSDPDAGYDWLAEKGAYPQLEKFSDYAAARYELRAEAAEGMEDVYVIVTGAPISESLDVVDAVLADDRFEVLGGALTHFHIPAYYDEQDPMLYITPEEGAELDADLLGQDAYGMLFNDGEYWHIRGLDGVYGDVELEDALTLCEKIAALDGVASAIPVGLYETSSETATVTALRIAALNAAGSGDLNSDGKTDLLDAIMLARLIAEDATLNIPASGLAESDVNGDGLLDMNDLTVLLDQLSGAAA